METQNEMSIDDSRKMLQYEYQMRKDLVRNDILNIASTLGTSALAVGTGYGVSYLADSAAPLAVGCSAGLVNLLFKGLPMIESVVGLAREIPSLYDCRNRINRFEKAVGGKE